LGIDSVKKLILKDQGLDGEINKVRQMLA